MKICDLGESILLTETPAELLFCKEPYLSTHRVPDNGQYSKASDLHSFGNILAFMIHKMCSFSLERQEGGTYRMPECFPRWTELCIRNRPPPLEMLMDEVLYTHSVSFQELDPEMKMVDPDALISVEAAARSSRQSNILPITPVSQSEESVFDFSLIERARFVRGGSALRP